MEGKRLGVLGALLCAAVAGSWMARADEPNAAREVVVAGADLQGGSQLDYGFTPIIEEPVPAGAHRVEGLEIFPVRSGARIINHYVNADGSAAAAAGPSETLIYSNTMGRAAVALGTGNLVSDDIAITAAPGCDMSRFEFDVTGLVNPQGTGGSFSVTWALYTVCPFSVPSAVRNNRIVPGTVGSMLITENIGDVHKIVVTPPPDVVVDLPTDFYLGLTFSRPNAGPIMGTPAQKGYSQDLFDFPGSVACSSNLGNFPEQLHASFNAQFWGVAEACPAGNLQYLAKNHGGPTFNPGADIFLVDDLQMLTANCLMVGYEVTVRGSGTYSFEFRNACGSGTIAGTAQQQLVGQSTPDTRTVGFVVDPPVPLQQNVWFAAKVNNQTGGVVVAGSNADIGRTGDLFGTGTCAGEALGDKIQQRHDSLNVTVICANEAPLGACCDMFVPQCLGGDDDGLFCRSNAECASPGTCERTCRQLPLANCSFPPVGTELLPRWQANQPCSPDPFDDPCGTSACCYFNPNELPNDPHCDNLTQNQCDAQEPLDKARQWQRGLFCSLVNQRCPLIACIAREGNCFQAHEGVGCDDSICCSDVCLEYDPFCCLSFWDGTCVEFATLLETCVNIPSNNECFGSRPGTGAATLVVNEQVTGNHDNATVSETDPSICCHNGQPPACLTGLDQGLTCSEQDPCADNGICGERPPQALATLWYQFQATQTTMRIETCGSNAPALDSVIQVFDAVDNSSLEAACDSLVPIGCSDDVAGCGGGKNARICLSGLTVGRTYYAMVGAKSFETIANYRVLLTAGCTPTGVVANDWCLGGSPVSEGTTAFNLLNTTLDCPADTCTPNMEHDMWFNYTPSCTGTATISTCDGNSGTSAEPNTNLAVYKGCDSCPPVSETLGCNQDSFVCGPNSTGSWLNVPVVAGECVKIRIGDELGDSPSGVLNISCESPCEAGSVTFLSPPNGVVDARRPHDPTNPTPALGIQEIRAMGPPGIESPVCWRVDCETALANFEDNEIESITEESPGSGIYVVRLTRPITPMGFTRVRYLGNPISDPSSAVRMTYHPLNVDGDFAASTADISFLVNILGGFSFPPFDDYSADIDQSGLIGPLDIIDAMDLANGSEFYESPLDTLLPATTPCINTP